MFTLLGDSSKTQKPITPSSKSVLSVSLFFFRLVMRRRTLRRPKTNRARTQPNAPCARDVLMGFARLIDSNGVRYGEVYAIVVQRRCNMVSWINRRRRHHHHQVVQVRRVVCARCRQQAGGRGVYTKHRRRGARISVLLWAWPEVRLADILGSPPSGATCCLPIISI